MKLRSNRIGGGVAIFTHKKLKCVPLVKYEKKEVEAMWAEVMVDKRKIVIGSAYIPPGATSQLKEFGEVLTQVCSENERIVLGMDANGRNRLWDGGVFENQSCTNRRMGDILADILVDNKMEVANNGSATHHCRDGQDSAIDVTATLGIGDVWPVEWRILNEDVRSDHSPILLEIGSSQRIQRVQVKDWKNFDWAVYEEMSADVLHRVMEAWKTQDMDSDQMNQVLTDALNDMANRLVQTKTVCKHSKPWFDERLAQQLKKQKAIKNSGRDIDLRTTMSNTKMCCLRQRL